jgi:flagellar hook assembly protein FlgD
VQGTEYVTQLAQFTAVEQSMAQSGKLDVLSTQLGGIASNEAVSLIGKDVTVRGKNVKAADNSAVDPTKDQKGTVVGISYDKGYAELTLSSGVTAPLSDLVGVNAPPAK